MSLIRHVPPMPGPRKPIEIHPDVIRRLRDLLFMPEMERVGYSAFINRACEVAETEIAEQRTREQEINNKEAE